MPQLDATAWTIWGAVIGLQLGLSWLMLSHWRRWPAVASLIWFKSAVSLFLLGLRLFDIATGSVGDTIPAVNFYTYWTASAISDVLQVWLIIEVTASVLPQPWRVHLARAIPALCVVYLSGALFITGYSSLSFPLEETRIVISLDRAASVAWLTVFICLYYASATVAGIRWERRELGVAIGLTLKMIGETSISWLLGVYPQHWHVLSTAQGALWICALLAWIGTFTGPARPDREQPHPEGLYAILNAFREGIRKLRAPE